MPLRVCQWCQSVHAGEFYKLDDDQYYCVPCAASRLYKSGRASVMITKMNYDQKMSMIERVLALDVSDEDVDNATKELQQWIDEGRHSG